MLCPDVMELVGQEVLKVRVVYQNVAKYDSVVAVMQDMFTRTYNLSREEPFNQCVRLAVGEGSGHKPPVVPRNHWDTFISDFKVLMYEIYLVRKFRRHHIKIICQNAEVRLGHGLPISSDVFGQQLSRGWGWGYKLNVEDDWYSPESEEIRTETYGLWENSYEGFMEMR